MNSPKPHHCALLLGLGVAGFAAPASIASTATGGDAVFPGGVTIVVDAPGNARAGLDGLCSLPEAIANANDDAATWPDCPAGQGPDTIVLTGPVELTDDWGDGNGTPRITASLTLQGQGHPIVVAAGRDGLRHLDVRGPEVRLALQDVLLRGGRAAGNGGAIRSVNASLSLERCVLIDNASSGDGGSVAVVSGLLSISGSHFEGNAAADGSGGALAVFEPKRAVSIGDSSFSGNRARDGGALYVSGGRLRVDGTAFRANEATRNSGALQLINASADVGQALFAGNVAGRHGGAVSSQAQDSGSHTLRLTHVTLGGNRAAAHGGAVASSAVGGHSLQQTLIEDSVVWGNLAEGGHDQIWSWSNPGAVERAILRRSVVESSSPLPVPGFKVITVDEYENPFVGAVPASEAPTVAGDYRLADLPRAPEVSGAPGSIGARPEVAALGRRAGPVRIAGSGESSGSRPR